LHDTVDFVLARFLPEEREVLRSVLDRCAEIVLEWRDGASVESLMGRHNGFVASPGGGEPIDPGERET
jgi:hypothetical protein